MNTENENQFYLGNELIKRASAKTEYTNEQIEEYVKCSLDIFYFIETYCKIPTVDHGVSNITLYPYQRKMIQQMVDERYSFFSTPRQVSKTASACLFILWFTIFRSDKDFFIVANKRDTAAESIYRITVTLENLPFWLQPGVTSLNKGSITFANGSRILSAATTSGTLRGKSGNVYIDEACDIDHFDDFLSGTLPVLSSGKTTKIIITTTPSRQGTKLYELYRSAKNGVGEFKLFEVAWNEAPGRDEAWREKTIDTIGLRKFNIEYMAQWLSSSGSLIDSFYLEKIYSGITEGKIVNDIKIYDAPIKDHVYFISVDVSRGAGIDNSAFSVIDITEYPYKQVATYYNNLVSTMFFPSIIHNAALLYNEAFVLVETNDAGLEVANILYYDLEYENVLFTIIKGRSGQVLCGPMKQAKLGVKTSKATKSVGCNNLKTLVESNNLEIYDKDTFNELSAFIVSGTSYQADDDAHDDLVMTLVNFSWAANQHYFKSLIDADLRKHIFENTEAELEQSLVPFVVVINEPIKEENDDPTYLSPADFIKWMQE